MRRLDDPAGDPEAEAEADPVFQAGYGALESSEEPVLFFGVDPSVDLRSADSPARER